MFISLVSYVLSTANDIYARSSPILSHTYDGRIKTIILDQAIVYEVVISNKVQVDILSALNEVTCLCDTA